MLLFIARWKEFFSQRKIIYKSTKYTKKERGKLVINGLISFKKFCKYFFKKDKKKDLYK
jgi:hypothetical protein